MFLHVEARVSCPATVFTSVPKDTDFCIKRRKCQTNQMVVQTLGTTGVGSQTHLILARFDTKVDVF